MSHHAQSEAAGSDRGHPPARTRPAPPPPPDLAEKGAPRDGQPQTMDRRLFMKLQVYTDCTALDELMQAIEAAKLPGVLYESIHDPTGVGLLSWAEDPAWFLDVLHPVLRAEPFAALTPMPEFTMLGRTYSLGYEPDLQEVLFDRPIERALSEQYPWAVWYPLRRAGAFGRLEPAEQREMLMEHGRIGMAFGAAELAHDIRLACNGLNPADNDFVVGLVSPRLHPLSAIVQTMRSTRQTAEFLENLGPFFVGRAAWRSRGAS